MASLYANFRSFLGVTTPEQRDDAAHVREQKKMLRSLEKKLDRRMARVAEAYTALDDIIDPLERWRVGDDFFPPPGVGLSGRPDARKGGADSLLLRTPIDLQRLRGDSRDLLATNARAAGFLDQLMNFIIGVGLEVDFSLKGVKKGAVATGVADLDGDGNKDVDPAVELAQIVWDEFCQLNDWGCGEEDREAECYTRLERDGELFVRFFAGDADTNGIPRIRFIEPEQVEPPPDAKPNESFGIITGVGDVETRKGIYVRSMDDVGTNAEGKVVPAAQVVFSKINTDRTIKRGIPSFAVVAKAFRQVEIIETNLAEVAGIQAAIAYVRQHAPGTMPAQIQTLISDGSDFDTSPGRSRSRNLTDRTVKNQITDPGTVIDMNAGMVFNAGPAATGTPAFIQSLQSRLRGICARFCMPEFFTGDASNNNLASAMIAGGPLEKSALRKQKKPVGYTRAIVLKVLEYARDAGRLSADDFARIEVTVTPPGVTIANKLEETQIRQIENQAGVLSAQTWQQQAGYDSRQEAANVKAWKAANPDPSGGGMDFGGLFGGGGQPPGKPDAGQPAQESVREQVERILAEVGAPPFPGAVFNRSNHRWEKPGEAGGERISRMPAEYASDGPKTAPSESPKADAKATETAGAWLDKSKPELSPEIKERYRADMAAVLTAMPAGSRKAAEESLSEYASSVTFHPDIAAVTDACSKASKRKEKNVGGFVVSEKGMDHAQLNIDGGTTDGHNNAAQSIYAHELGHVIDAGGKFSDDPKWVSAHKSDILKNKEGHMLSRYALTSPSESFAEFHRVVVEKGGENAKMKYPKCFAFFAAKGLL